MTSFNIQEASCRLCLETILDKNYEVIDDLTKYSLLLRLKFEVGSKHIICSYCWEKLNAALEFKSTCLNTDNTIIPYVNSEEMLQLDLRDVYLLEKENEQLTGISVDQKVCRLCMQLVKTNYRYIHDEEVATIQKFVPEMKINIVKDPIVCIQCFDSLSTHNSFLTRCFPVDEKIEKICDTSAAECETNDISPFDLFIKMENVDSESKINDTEMSLKVEPINIKLEEDEEESETSLHGEEFIDGEIAGRDSPNLYGSKHRKPFNLQMYECDTSDFENNLLQHHLNYKDLSEVPLYKCDTCDFRTKYKFHLPRHQLKHKDISAVQVYKCDSCDYRSKYKNNLKQHQLTHKNFSEVPVYKCDACDFRTKYKIRLSTHQLKHKDISEVQMYKCDTCDFRTKHKIYLSTHQLKHKDISEVRLYKCDACGYRSKYKNHLKQHQLIHKDFSEVPIYKCASCDFITKHKNYLIAHQLKHKDISKVQVFKCNTCDFKTKYRTSLRKHQLGHKDSLEVPIYKCNTCDFKTKFKGNLIKHQLQRCKFTNVMCTLQN